MFIFDQDYFCKSCLSASRNFGFFVTYTLLCLSGVVLSFLFSVLWKLIKMTLEAIKYKRGKLDILDQLLLPLDSVYITINDTEDAWNAIRKMQVRGAPAIAIVGCLSLGVELLNKNFQSTEELAIFIVKQLEYLVSSRPTAVNMKEAANRYSKLVKNCAANSSVNVEDLKHRMIGEFEKMFRDDVATNKAMGQYGADHILKASNNKPVGILTHCNTGSLATAGYGTALGVIRMLHEMDALDQAYCTETRPYNQGARLTAYELVFEHIPSTLICDSMVSMVMNKKKVDAVIVGADRVVCNGDTANKIGTYQIAICAKHHGIPFYVACPLTSFDPNLQTGDDIVIEERPQKEMTQIGGVQIAAKDINCFNPAFDVTPAQLITGGIITEHGVFPADKLYEHVQTIQS